MKSVIYVGNPSAHNNMQFGGTPFFIDIFGMMFMINLEELPVLQNPTKQADESVDEVLEAIYKTYSFELISLN